MTRKCSECKHFSNTFNEFREWHCNLQWHCNLHGSQVSITFPHSQMCDDFEPRDTCQSCVHCDASTLTELNSVYCNKLQIAINDYKAFSCSKFKEE